MERRDFLTCMAWVGTGVAWSLKGGVLHGAPLEQMAHHAGTSGLQFVQISDSHIGFNKEANTDVTDTLRDAVAKITAAHQPPAFVIHTGDLTHLSKPEQFATLDDVLGDLRVPVHYVPGEHDILNDNGRQYLDRFGKGTSGTGWYSFDSAGVHFIGLVNVADLKAGGLGSLGDEQIAWIERDLKRLSSSTPIVLFAHIPLWSVYPEWGWGTDDSARALALLKRFGSVAVLNGHIHQVMQKVEGNVTFHTAMSTAFPQPAPGSAPSPGPMTVEADRLRTLLGLTSLSYHDIHHPVAITDTPLGSASPAAGQVTIDNFSFSPDLATVTAGSTITWTNHDDEPHNIVSTEKKFASPVIDTGERYSRQFDAPGTYEYYCSIHPKMRGRVEVR